MNAAKRFLTGAAVTVGVLGIGAGGVCRLPAGTDAGRAECGSGRARNADQVTRSTTTGTTTSTSKTART
jgi:hypothetical protein